MTAAPNAGSGYQLQIGACDLASVSVVMYPQQSVLRLLRRAASGPPGSGPGDLSAAVGKALRPRARFAVQAFAARGVTLVPECCAPIPPLADASVPEQAGRLREMPAEVLTEELRAVQGSCQAFASQWRVAGQQPRRWLNSLADASLDAWSVFEPRWRAAGPLLDREVRRVGTAVVRNGTAALLNNLHPRITYADGMLSVAFPHDNSFTLGRRRLVLLPMIAQRHELAVSFERPDVCYIAYPVTGAGPGVQAAADSALALILGPLRAATLVALRQPLTVGELAVAVQCAPTTATYHLDQLAKAGMITRERRGTSVRVSRTTRGDELVDLLSD
jgi:DNA-binding transcriptional ArsR family regulator